ncbi:MAG: hypothetical protein H0V18_12735, partial [Pyrinomonadaceae bacterium]|nr:hypothetical protein [Pyrinomonadaceae bacterium]
MQRCGCPVPAADQWPRTWKGYDHNTYAELCRCCGLVLLPSGTKWSVWFCDDCKPLVIAFNRALGRCVVPIGRHSIMNGVGARGADLVSNAAIEQIADGVQSMIAGIEALEVFAGLVTMRNVTTLGFDAASDVPLKAYLRAVERSE